MPTLLDAIVALLAMLFGGAAIAHYWHLVDQEGRDDPLPDPTLMALLQAQPDLLATADPSIDARGR
jgi:hypothetical protein